MVYREVSMPRQRAVSEVYRKDMRFRVDNSYRRRAKYPSDTKCPQCGLLFQSGVWQWKPVDPSHPLRWKLCPACLQIRDRYAGGVLRLSGSFVGRRSEEILRRIRNLEKRALAEHPLERIMSIEESKGEVRLLATAEHLVVCIGKSLRRDFGGELEIKYAPDEKFADVRWSKND